MANLGSATNLVGGTLTLTIPSGTKYWYIQNQDTGALLVTFPAGSGFGPIALAGSSATGAPGDWLDSVGIPFRGASLTLTSGVATGQFGAGYSLSPPTNIYPAPESLG